uniref:Reverse transcriptase domain-containing protein n=1 Tax=Tanacetum cinerariifolium TaxID=118510 RepID=A0A699GQ67_TANCI|nr:reverse transcriptase domain-containing protein [Tanacetum cinerariifolium]
MDAETMWAANCAALNLGSVITIPDTAKEFAFKGNDLTLVKGNQFDGIIKTNPHKHIHEFLRICDMFKYKDTKNEADHLMMFPLSLTGEAKTWLDELNKGTIKTWDELRTAFISIFFPPSSFDRLLGEIQAFSQHENETLTEAWLLIQVKQKQLNLRVDTKRMTFHMDFAMKYTYSNDDTCFSINVIDEILEEDFDAHLNEDSKILYSIERTILEEKLYAEFDEFMEMTTKENSESESDTEETPLKNHL